jgi:hypothetical protein
MSCAPAPASGWQATREISRCSTGPWPVNLSSFDFVGPRFCDVFVAWQDKERGSMIQSMTGKPVQFVIIETTRLSDERSIRDPELAGLKFRWPYRINRSPHLARRLSARIVRVWAMALGLKPGA